MMIQHKRITARNLMQSFCSINGDILLLKGTCKPILTLNRHMYNKYLTNTNT